GGQVVHYCKATQTLGGESGSSVEKDFYPVHHFEWDDEFTGAQRTAPSSAGTQCSPVEEVFPSLGLDAHQLAAGLLLPHVELVKPTEVRSEKTILDEKQQNLVVKLLSDEEKQKILVQPEFRHFLDKSSKILERALTEKWFFTLFIKQEESIFVDYSKNERSTEKEVDFDQKLSINRVFFDEKWSKSRCVTCMDHSPQHPELLAVSYTNNEEAPNEPEGVVLVWNNKFKKTTPEYIFHCQSRVLSISWAKFHPNLLLGGTYSGQICLWDNRQNKRTPVQKSPLSASAHTHPVYCLKVVGTQNAHNLITASTDGKLCSWSLDMLAKPLECVDLQLKQSKQVAATCFDFPPNDVNNFFVGSEDSSVYACCRHGMGQKGGGGLLETAPPFDGHHGPVTGLSCHAAAGVGGGAKASGAELTAAAISANYF
uniref:Uncharacterized protein n=1 Tax=Romanomermis culicivorax TaxID=13658 RepID=A0A915IG34_ROMCU